MTLHGLLHAVSAILTPEDDAFFSYALHTFDDDGSFLRTRWCWWEDRPLADMVLPGEIRTVLLTARAPIVPEDLRARPRTRAKLQLHYGMTDATLADSDWDVALGYPYVYLIDLVAGRYTVTFRERL